MTEVRLRNSATALVGLTGIGPVEAAPTRNSAAIASITAFAQGADGSPGARYVHTQGTASALWTVPHNLGFRPIVTVFTTGGQEVLGGEILHLSLSTLTITFDAAFAGSAACV